MDSNKDEALRCVGIAKEAIAAGNKQKALKFIGIARRLNQTLSVDDLMTACEDLESPSSSQSANGSSESNGVNIEAAGVKVNEVRNGERAYSEENVQLVRQVKTKNDYYAILGVEKSCSVEEIRKAYRKLSLKVHPDKNKAPGSEEAFKKVSKAFKCLSDDESRRQYDQTGLVEDFEYNQQHNVRRRRRRPGNNFYEDEFDADEIFRAFFGQNDIFRSRNVYQTRAAGGQQRGVAGNGSNLMILLQLLPFLIIILLAYLPFSEPEYSLQRNYTYQFRQTTELYDVEYFVKSSDFDQSYPHGSSGRQNIEYNVIKDYKNMLGRYCHIEIQRRQWNRNYPTPHCDRLQEFTVA